MINKENVQKLIDLVDDLPDEKFNMVDFFVPNDCGTAYCLCGLVNCILLDRPRECAGNERAARTFLGFSDDLDLGYELFYGGSLKRPDVTREMAINVLKILRDTGRVDWKAVGAPHYEDGE